MRNRHRAACDRTRTARCNESQFYQSTLDLCERTQDSAVAEVLRSWGRRVEGQISHPSNQMHLENNHIVTDD